MTLKLVGFEELEKILNPFTFEGRMEKAVKQATKRIGLLAEAEVKQSINNGDYKPNSALTIALKGSERPLVNTGNLVNAINSKVVSATEVVVGLIRNTKHIDPATGKSKGIIDIGRVLHDGATIPVSFQMRMFFFALANENPNIKPLKDSTVALVIPARPFLEASVSENMIRLATQQWVAAIDAVFEGR